MHRSLWRPASPPGLQQLALRDVRPPSVEARSENGSTLIAMVPCGGWSGIPMFASIPDFFSLVEIRLCVLLIDFRIRTSPGGMEIFISPRMHGAATITR
jgi:hypothetical protein